MQSIEDNKKITVTFLEMIVSGKIAEAYKKYADMSGKHHNIFSPAGFPGLQKAMQENDAQFPNKKITIKHVLGDGNLVVAHSQLILGPAKTDSMIVVHMLRFDNGKIVELWDCGQMVPAEIPNTDGAF